MNLESRYREEGEDEDEGDDGREDESKSIQRILSLREPEKETQREKEKTEEEEEEKEKEKEEEEENQEQEEDSRAFEELGLTGTASDAPSLFQRGSLNNQTGKYKHEYYTCKGRTRNCICLYLVLYSVVQHSAVSYSWVWCMYLYVCVLQCSLLDY